MKPKYQRVIIKVSGESLADHIDSSILDNIKLTNVAKAIKDVRDLGVSIGIVIGAGNIWRGRLAEKIGIDPAKADYMGMLGTIMNAIALQSALNNIGLESEVMSLLEAPKACASYSKEKAIQYLDSGKVVIFAGGTGEPFFTTDTAAAMRAKDINAEAILMGKNGVDGILDSDPRLNPEAKLLKKITYQEIIERKLGVMDLSAAEELKDTSVEIRVFNMAAPDILKDVILGKDLGTFVSKE